MKHILILLCLTLGINLYSQEVLVANLPEQTTVGNSDLFIVEGTNTSRITMNNLRTAMLSPWSGSVNLTTLGTIGTGVWNGTVITPAYGGTGLTTIATMLNSNTTSSDVGLGNVENTALSTWPGSTNITITGTIAQGTWEGTVIANDYITNTLTGKTYNGVTLSTAGAATSYLDETGAYSIPAGSNSTSYTNSTPTPETIGGIESGSTFDDVSQSDMWDDLLYPYQYPAFTSFIISGQATTLECGIEIPAGVVTWTWGTINPTNIETNSIDIYDVTGSSNIITGTANDGTEDASIGASPITKTVTATQNIWRITGTNTQTEDFTRNFVVTWYSPFYYGSGAQGLTVAQVQALTKSVTATGTKQYTFNPTSQVMYIAYPAAYGTLSSILDPNGFETVADWTLSVVDFTNNEPDYYGNTASYNVYEYNNLTTQTDFEITFIF